MCKKRRNGERDTIRAREQSPPQRDDLSKVELAWLPWSRAVSAGKERETMRYHKLKQCLMSSRCMTKVVVSLTYHQSYHQSNDPAFLIQFESPRDANGEPSKKADTNAPQSLTRHRRSSRAPHLSREKWPTTSPSMSPKFPKRSA